VIVGAGTEVLHLLSIERASRRIDAEIFQIKN